jgi:hypothetical protein
MVGAAAEEYNASGTCLQSRSASPDKMDDLHPVAGRHRGLGPRLPWDDGSVQFDGDPVGLDAEFLNNPVEGSRFCEFEVAGLSVDLKR